MPITVTMPRLSDTMERGTVVKWHVKEGDAVNQGDMIADIETDKATMELEAFDSGTVAKLAAAEGEKVPVGETIMVIAESGESVESAAASVTRMAAAEQSEGSGVSTPAPSASTAVAEPAQTPTSQPDSTSTNGSRIFASPLARKVAAERGIDLATIHGTGPGGRVTRKDVESAGVASAGGPARRAVTPEPGSASRATPSPAPVPMPAGALEEKTVPLTGMRETIARRLVESKTTIPHYQVTTSARIDSLLELREQLNSQLEPQGVKLSVNDFLVRACALAMHGHPFVNSSWNPKGPAIDLHARVNIGVAIALPAERGGGLVVATLRDADRTGLRQISAETKRLAKKARDKGLTIEEMSDSTFTISNLGMFGVDHFTAIINPPNAAILAVGRAVQKPFVEEDEDGEPVLVVGHEMSMTMSSDHRVVDGAMAAAYLATVKELLENPATLLV
ncbi:MAG: 2-oxo acid dehydrogenase subunit E2 [Phycisphaeraceae bacterium]|nr:MAG: 2-oxo acid dehydrogenase subunit E2 [Phycisphaeraceae bacterium]